MANRPSSRTNRMRPDSELNLTPMIDMITCLMFFLMMFASLLPVVVIDAPLPRVATTAADFKKAQENEKQTEIILTINTDGFDLKVANSASQKFPVLADGRFPYDKMHKTLVQIQQNQKIQKADFTLLPNDATPYEVIIGTMDATRELMREDPGYQPVPADIASKPESQQFNRLFPEVSIGGL